MHRRIRSVLVAAAAVLAAGTVAGCGAGLSSIDPHCTAGTSELDTGQTSVAAQMVGEVYQSGIEHPDRAAVLALAAALQESKLTNLAPGDGDRDSVGVLQQRPSQDWGKAAGEPTAEPARTQAREKRLLDVTEATREFLVKLAQIDNWWTLAAADAIQQVQISADGSLYAQHEPVATDFAKALLGTTPAGLGCAFDAPTVVTTTATVSTALRHQLGLTAVTATPQAVRVAGAGWQTAAWFVANADRYGIARVEFSAHTWTRSDGWATSSASAGAVLATMATPGG